MGGLPLLVYATETAMGPFRLIARYMRLQNVSFGDFDLDADFVFAFSLRITCD